LTRESPRRVELTFDVKASSPVNLEPVFSFFLSIASSMLVVDENGHGTASYTHVTRQSLKTPRAYRLSADSAGIYRPAHSQTHVSQLCTNLERVSAGTDIVVLEEELWASGTWGITSATLYSNIYAACCISRYPRWCTVERITRHAPPSLIVSNILSENSEDRC
jgi:hypothetical protein